MVKLFIFLAASVGLWNGINMARTLARMRRALKETKEGRDG